MSLQPLPAAMEAILHQSGDFQTPAPGKGPVWLQIGAEIESAEIVVYRTLPGILHVVAPIAS